MARTAKTKNMNFVELKEMYKTKKKVVLDKDLHVDVYPNFTPTKIVELREDFKKVFSEKQYEILHESKIDENPEFIDNGKYNKLVFDYFSGSVLDSVVYGLIIKHFTSVEVDAETYDDILFLANVFVTRKYLDKVLPYFNQVDVNGVFNEINAVISKWEEINQKLMDEQVGEDDGEASQPE